MKTIVIPIPKNVTAICADTDEEVPRSARIRLKSHAGKTLHTHNGPLLFPLELLSDATHVAFTGRGALKFVPSR